MTSSSLNLQIRFCNKKWITASKGVDVAQLDWLISRDSIKQSLLAKGLGPLTNVNGVTPSTTEAEGSNSRKLMPLME